MIPQRTHSLAIRAISGSLAIASVLIGSWASAQTQPASAPVAEASATASVDTTKGFAASHSGTASSGAPHAPFEAGLFGGLMLPPESHDLQGPHPHRQLATAGELGLRLAGFISPHAGIEFEGAVLPTKIEDGDRAALWTGRAHVLGQLPLGGVTPFVLLGAGALGISSDELGADVDHAFHAGIGVKVPVDEFLSLRLDARDTVSQKNGGAPSSLVHYPEFLLGLSFRIGGEKKAPPADEDADGILDAEDKCPAVAGPAPAGCPAEDTDKDGVQDKEDRCHLDAGPAPSGCPAPADADADGVPDTCDACPKDAGIKPSGCPDEDPDQDGIRSSNDRCPREAEVKNGFEDADGCPDTLPESVKRFTGTIQGIEFDFAQATIRPASGPTLESAAKTLQEHPSLRIEISGHTDNVGPREANVKLSLARAEAVKQDLIKRGVEADRIEVRGAGPDQPVADNLTPQNRQKNRRIEFRILTEQK
jgi:OOP family OmpA-OmpF porin